MPKSKDGTAKYDNLTLVLASVHKLIHAADRVIICEYLKILSLTEPQKAKLNELRRMAGVDEII